MGKFNVGDTVRILDSNGSDLKIGSEHRVEMQPCDWYGVAGFYFNYEHLELVSTKEGEEK